MNSWPMENSCSGGAGMDLVMVFLSMLMAKPTLISSNCLTHMVCTSATVASAPQSRSRARLPGPLPVRPSRRNPPPVPAPPPGGRAVVVLVRPKTGGTGRREGASVSEPTEVTYYRRRSEYGGLKGDQVKRLKELEAENTRLRRAVSDLTLEKLILREAASGNF